MKQQLANALPVWVLPVEINAIKTVFVLESSQLLGETGALGRRGDQVRKVD